MSKCLAERKKRLPTSSCPQARVTRATDTHHTRVRVKRVPTYLLSHLTRQGLAHRVEFSAGRVELSSEVVKPRAVGPRSLLCSGVDGVGRLDYLVCKVSLGALQMAKVAKAHR